MKHEDLCPTPTHPLVHDCSYCLLIKKSHTLGYVRGRNDAAKDVKAFLMSKLGVGFLETIHTGWSVAKGWGRDTR
jgi:hypothetical protein